MSQRNIIIFMALTNAYLEQQFFCWNLTLLMTNQLEIIIYIFSQTLTSHICHNVTMCSHNVTLFCNNDIQIYTHTAEVSVTVFFSINFSFSI